MNVWDRAGKEKGADQKFHGQGGQGHRSLFPSESPASGLVTHWDLLGGIYVQYSPTLPRRGTNLTLGQ